MSVSAGTVGDVIGDQVEPFQSSMFAASVLTLSPLPTATHQSDVTQETLVIPLVWFAVLLVLDIVVQFDALTCAGTVRPCGVAAWAPPEPRSASAMSGAATPAVRNRTGARIDYLRGSWRVATRRRAECPHLRSGA